MRIINVEKVGKKPVYDLSVEEVEHYALKNGVITHNTGNIYSSNQIFIITKAQEKEGTDLAGWKFTINIEKSRYVREKAKLPFKVTYDGGIQKWDAIFDLALEFGLINKPKMGWYQMIDPDTGEVSEKNYRLADVMKMDEYFEKLIKNADFNEFIEKKYKLGVIKISGDPKEIVDETDTRIFDIDD